MANRHSEIVQSIAWQQHYRTDYSLPASLAKVQHKYTVKQLRQFNPKIPSKMNNSYQHQHQQQHIKNDANYIPNDQALSQSDNSTSYYESSRGSSYDPLENLEEYMKFRQQN